jgi:hypothetical protein
VPFASSEQEEDTMLSSILFLVSTAIGFSSAAEIVINPHGEAADMLRNPQMTLSEIAIEPEMMGKAGLRFLEEDPCRTTMQETIHGALYVDVVGRPALITNREIRVLENALLSIYDKEASQTDRFGYRNLVGARIDKSTISLTSTEMQGFRIKFDVAGLCKGCKNDRRFLAGSRGGRAQHRTLSRSDRVRKLSKKGGKGGKGKKSKKGGKADLPAMPIKCDCPPPTKDVVTEAFRRTVQKLVENGTLLRLDVIRVDDVVSSPLARQTPTSSRQSPVTIARPPAFSKSAPSPTEQPATISTQRPSLPVTATPTQKTTASPTQSLISPLPTESVSDTLSPIAVPTAGPEATNVPTARLATDAPSTTVTAGEPTVLTTDIPTSFPATEEPTLLEATNVPTARATEQPSILQDSSAPSNKDTRAPLTSPPSASEPDTPIPTITATTAAPMETTLMPSEDRTSSPSQSDTPAPTVAPLTSEPTAAQTMVPTIMPLTSEPTLSLTMAPTAVPLTSAPTVSVSLTMEPTPACSTAEFECCVGSDCLEAGEICFTGTCIDEGSLRFTLYWEGDDDLVRIVPSQCL